MLLRRKKKNVFVAATVVRVAHRWNKNIFQCFRDESYDDDNPSGGWWGVDVLMGFAVLLVLLLH